MGRKISTKKRVQHEYWTQADIISQIQIRKKSPPKHYETMSSCVRQLQRTSNTILYAFSSGKLPLSVCYAYRQSTTTRPKLYIDIRALKKYFEIKSDPLPIESIPSEDNEEEIESTVTFDEDNIAEYPVVDLQTAKYRNEVLKIKRSNVELRHANNELIDRIVLDKVTISLATELRGMIEKFIIQACPKLAPAKTINECRNILRKDFSEIAKDYLENIDTSFIEAIEEK